MTTSNWQGVQGQPINIGDSASGTVVDVLWRVVYTNTNGGAVKYVDTEAEARALVINQNFYCERVVVLECPTKEDA